MRPGKPYDTMTIEGSSQASCRFRGSTTRKDIAACREVNALAAGGLSIQQRQRARRLEDRTSRQKARLRTLEGSMHASCTQCGSHDSDHKFVIWISTGRAQSSGLQIYHIGAYNEQSDNMPFNDIPGSRSRLA